jgi:murein DD-endopeptidase MepM/ murein hydrolase activator NlpD
MFKVKYHFDETTLTFKRVRLVRKQKIYRVSAFLIVTVSTAVILNILASTYLTTPKLSHLENEKQEYIMKYDILKEKLADVEIALNEIQHRDDHLYRAIFDLDPIAPSVREAGIGGVNRYMNLEGYVNSDLIIETYKKVDDIRNKLYVQSRSFDVVIDYAKNKEKMLACVPAIQPVALKDFDRISDYFGFRSDPFNNSPTMHYGMDFTGPEGADIFATGDGVVIEAGYSFYGYGNRITIDHGFGYRTVYAHLQKINVVEGQKVSRGDIIGKLGNTGRSTGTHLHYEVRINDKPVDPINFYFNDITAEEYDLMILALSKRRIPMD